jgi:hypothetical protein
MTEKDREQASSQLTAHLLAYQRDPTSLPSLLTFIVESLSSHPLPSLVEALADLARTQQGREGIIDKDIPAVIVCRDWTGEPPADLATQICRLGGNLCFDSPEGRETVSETGLLTKLDVLLRRVEHDCRVWTVLPTFLHNFCADNMQSLGQVRELADLAAEHLVSQDSDLAVPEVDSFLNFLSGLNDHEGKVMFFNRLPIIRSMMFILKHLKEEESQESLFELLQDLCEDEGISNMFIDYNLLPILLDLGLQSKQSLDLLALLSSHPSVLPRILSSDSPLNHLLPSWLGPQYPSPHHAATAALIFGNYSTTDSACTHLVSSTTVPATLVTLLEPSSPPEVLHGVVGCLRNLSVCQSARELLLGLFLPQACVQLLLHLENQSNHTVTPKLVATLRLVTQGNSPVCCSLGQDPHLLPCLARIGKLSIVPGLTIEVARLACSLVRYSNEFSVICNALDSNCLPLITSLLNSSHPQLLNEVIVFLNFAAAHRPPHPQLVEQLDLPFLTSRLGVTLDLQDCPKEIKVNVLTLISNLLEWKLTGVTDALKESNIRQCIERFDCETSVSKSILEQL